MTNKEQQIRQYIREFLKSSMLKEVDEEEPTEKAPVQKKKEEPKEDKSVIDLKYAKKAFISKLSTIPNATEFDVLVETLSDIIESVGLSNEEKLSLLKTIKNNIVQ